VEIATLEATVKAELEEKNEVLDQLMKERGGNFYVTLSIATLAVLRQSLQSTVLIVCRVL
jgi:hypothetical protein